jgi:F-type H+-transporting ATPase subunit b
MDLVPNWTLVLMLWLPFAVSLAALKFLLVDPMYQWLQGRLAATAGARHDAERLQREALDKAAELDKALATARDEAARLRASYVERAQESERKVVAAARSAAEARIGEAVALVRAEAAAARETIPETSRSISLDIAGQLLGRNVSA